MSDLDEVLNGEDSPEKPRNEKGQFTKGEEPVEQPSQVPESEEPETPAGEQDDSEETPEEPEEEPEKDQPKEPKEKPSDESAGLRAGIAAERKKRQEIERQLAALRQQQEQPKAPDLYENPEGYQQHIQQTLQSALIDERVNLSAAFARKQYTDYDEVMEHWGEMVSQDPTLYQHAIQQELPADWAYNQVKRQLLLAEIDDPTTYKERLRAEMRAELEAELRAQKPQPKPTPPPSLASAPGGGTKSEPTFSGPTPLHDLFRN